MKSAPAPLIPFEKPATLRARVEDFLRTSIMQGRYRSGERLREMELCEELGISRSTLREALRTLEAERLITMEPHRGPTVACMSEKAARDLYAIRALLEGYAAHAFARLASDADVERLRKVADLNVISNPVSSPMHVRFYSDDADSPLFKREVRLALNYAVDADAIIKSVFHGVGAPMSTFISRYYPYGSSPDIAPYPYDPAKAKQLLAQAGYPNGFEITLNDAVGTPKEMAEAVAAYLGQIGVRVKINRIDYAAWSRLNNAHKTGPMTTTQFTNAIYDPIHPIAGSFSKNGSWSNYYNPEVEALIAKLDSTTGADARGALFRQIGQLLHDDGAALLVTELFDVYAKKSNLDWAVQEGSGFLNFRQLSWK